MPGPKLPFGHVVITPGTSEKLDHTKIDDLLPRWATSILVARGHGFSLKISSNNYPPFDVNPNTGGNIATETILTEQAVFWGEKTPSRIALSIVHR